MPNLLHSDESSDASSENESFAQTEPLDTEAGFHSPLQEVNLTKDIPSKESKVAIRFQPIGSTPLIKPQNFQVSGKQTISSIMKFLMKRLRLKTVHIYVLSSFQPTPDESLESLHTLFKTNNELILSYCEQIAYG